MLPSNNSSCLIKISANIGEKSKPPADGINLLIGVNNFVEISSISFNKGFGFPGATQLKTTEPIIEKKNTVSIVFITSTTETRLRTNKSY